MRWIDSLGGTECVTVCARERRIFAAAMMRAGITAVRIRNTDDGGLEAELRRRDHRQLCQQMTARGLPCPEHISSHGLPCVLRRLCRRPGLPVGMVLALAIWIFSTLFVWRVDVVCLDNAQGTAARDFVDVTEIREALADEGIGLGMFLPGLDARRLENHFLRGREDISWMAINRHGTVLSVEVRPAHTASKEQDPKLTVDEEGYLCGTNLVADADGRVLSFSVRGGQMVVGAEQMVLRGTLLASGIYLSDTGDAVGGRAHGEVIAETVRIVQAVVPLVEQTVQTTGQHHTMYTLSLFGKSVISVCHPLPTVSEIVTFLETFRKNGEKSGISTGSCGIIADETISEVTKSELHLPGGLPLPVSVCVTTRTGVKKESRILTNEEALNRAKAVLDAEEAALGARRILSREEAVEYSDDHLTVTRYVFCIDNIAVEEEFRIKPQP